MSTSVKLSIFLNGELKGVKVVPLPCVVGRSRESGVVISHPLVSRKHCMLCLENGELRLRDLGSLNGVVYQGNQVIDAILANDEVFYIGNVSFMARLVQGESPISTPLIEPRNQDGVYQGAPKSPRPLKLPPHPLNSSIPAGSSTQYIPLPPASMKAIDNRISPEDLSDVVDLSAKSNSQDSQESMG